MMDRRPGQQAPARRMGLPPASVVTVLDERRRHQPRIRRWWMTRRHEDRDAIARAISDHEAGNIWGRHTWEPKLDVIVRFQRWARWFRREDVNAILMASWLMGGL